MTATAETHRFEAEVQRVLELVVHSLYTRKEIFLRELISNASDALDKLRFEALTSPDLMSGEESLGIVLEVDREARILRVGDNGIGMSRDELVENLGRIASSGTRRFLEALQARNKEGQDAPDLIGQFGVGFYSAFIVADQLTVETRRAGQDQGWRWSSAGQGEYTIEEAEGLGRGTVVSLHLRSAEEPDDKELDELLDEWKVREIVARYSDFVEYPIQMEVERKEVPTDDEGKPIEDAEPETVTRVETLNSMKPLWARPKEEIKPEEYEEFYRHHTHDWGEPLRTIHFKAEGALEYTALLYVPAKRGMDLFDPEKNKSRLALYVRRVLIMRECEDLLPSWLRFVRGVVESADLPLNVSRETLQDSPKIRPIRRRLVRKVLEDLAELLEKDRQAYEGFWEGFGSILKEGLYHGEDEEGRLSSIALFWSTRPAEKGGDGESVDGWTTLSEYVERMPVAQKEIYTLSGPDRATLERSPHLESLRSKKREVLLMTDPVDEWMLQRFREFEGKPLRAIEQGDLDLEEEAEKQEREKQQEEMGDLLIAIAAKLEDEVKEVRFSSRLENSAAVLVNDPNAPSAHMERLLRNAGQPVPKAQRTLELNPSHALIGGLKKLHAVDANSPRIADYARLLYGQALLTEGSPLPDPAGFSKLVTELMVTAVES